MARFTSKGTYITDTEDADRSYDMTGMGDVIAITRLLNSFHETNRQTEIDLLSSKLNTAESQRDEAVMKLNSWTEEAMLEHCKMRDLIHRVHNCLVCLPISFSSSEEIATNCFDMIQEEFTEEELASFAPAVLHNYYIGDNGKLTHILGE